MSGVVFTSVSIWTAWEKLFSFLQAFAVASFLVPSASAGWVAMDLEELRKLERTTQRILATLQDAEVHWNIQQESSKLRLRELKEVACDVKGVVMEYEYEADRCKMHDISTPANASATRKMRRIQWTLVLYRFHMNSRLRELKEVACDVKGVVMEYEYKADRCKLEALKRSARYHTPANASATSCLSKRENEPHSVDTDVVHVPHKFASRVRKIAERFREIMHFLMEFNLSEDDGEKRLFTPDSSCFRQIGSFLLEKRVLRRDKEKDMIVVKLLCGEERNQGSHVSVLAIVGMGGLGKMTLAQIVYNDPRLCHSFDEHAWVYVSENFHINAITRDIINSITKVTCEFYGT